MRRSFSRNSDIQLNYHLGNCLEVDAEEVAIQLISIY